MRECRRVCRQRIFLLDRQWNRIQIPGQLRDRRHSRRDCGYARAVRCAQRGECADHLGWQHPREATTIITGAMLLVFVLLLLVFARGRKTES